MASRDLNIKGLKELDDALRTLPEKLHKNVMRAALRAGMKEFQAEILYRVPIGTPSGEGIRLYGHYRGALRDSIKISTRSKRGIVTAKVTAGGKTKGGADVFYAHFLEFGTAAHQIRGARGGFLSFGGGRYRSVMHPGTKPQPFMRPALDAKAEAAVRAFASKVRSVLATKHGIDVPAPMEEGDE